MDLSPEVVRKPEGVLPAEVVLPPEGGSHRDFGRKSDLGHSYISKGREISA
jgi:hypothetical protein